MNLETAIELTVASEALTQDEFDAWMTTPDAQAAAVVLAVYALNTALDEMAPCRHVSLAKTHVELVEFYVGKALDV